MQGAEGYRRCLREHGLDPSSSDPMETSLTTERTPRGAQDEAAAHLLRALMCGAKHALHSPNRRFDRMARAST